jgi:hypothetical protein
VNGRGTRLLLAALGFVIGADSALCGIGGGVFAVPLLHFCWRVPLREAVAHSLLLVCASTTSATLSELVRADSALRFDLAGALIAGVVLGAWAGYHVARRLPPAWIQLLFALLLIGAALNLALAERAQAAFATARAAPVDLDVAALAQAACIGVLGGAAAPLFGVGGGLVNVPLLLWSMPALGFPVARAASMAASAVAAWQSVLLYRRGGELRGTAGLWLAAGALPGGLVGVELAHVDAVVRVARVLLVATLCFAAARFAWELAPSRVRGGRRPG